jgi:hypothetical protein
MENALRVDFVMQDVRSFSLRRTQDAVLAVKVMMQGFQLLPMVPTELAIPAEDLRERVGVRKGSIYQKRKNK